MIRAVKALAIAVCLAMCAASVAAADAKRKHKKKPVDQTEVDKKPADDKKPVDDDGETPWAKGVSKGKQKKALEVFKEGNALFEEGKYTEALAVYEQALKVWDHPNIQFNLAVCLFNIRQPLAAWDHLDSALRFGC